MTFYPASLLDSAAGHVQQIVLAAIYQQEANRDYVPDPLATDFTKNSVNWQLQIDTSRSDVASDQYGYLSISVTMPLLNDSPLVNRADLYQRIGTINNTDVAELSLAREATYIPASPPAPDPLNPDGLAGGTYPGVANDMLERRLVWLLETFMARFLYLKRWNNWAQVFHLYLGYYDGPDYVNSARATISSFDVFGLNGASRRLMQMGELPIVKLDPEDAGNYELALQQLIADADSFRYIFSKDSDSDGVIDAFDNGGSDITSAIGEENFYDPGTESNTNQTDSSPTPPSLNSAVDGATGNETPDNSLKDC